MQDTIGFEQWVKRENVRVMHEWAAHASGDTPESVELAEKQAQRQLEAEKRFGIVWACKGYAKHA